MRSRKDKTMVHILDTLARLENKFDNLALTSVASSSPDTNNPGTRASASQSSTSSNRQNEYGVARFPLELQQGYHHLTVPHKVILWPSIYISLINSGIGATSDLQYVLQEGTPWFIRQEMASHKDLLDPEPGLTAFVLDGRPVVSGQLTRFAFSGLTIQRIQELCEAYFNSFNVLAPLLNKETFMADTMSSILRDGFADGDSKTVLCLFVIALGQVALEGVFERPIGMVNGAPSGFRGGSVHKPPGLEIFNEARRRVGFVATEMTLINVQMMLLQATYYEATARHLDFWRSTVTASMACQVLIKCQTVDWQSSYGDMLKRAYWTCVLSEDLYHLDLDLPQTGVQELEDTVPLPYFHEGSESATHPLDDRSNFQYHFLAMIALRRLIHRIHEVIHECKLVYCSPQSCATDT